MVGLDWYYLSTVLDDYARYIITWMLGTSMQAADVMETLNLARTKTGLDRVQVVHCPRLLSDNGPATSQGNWWSIWRSARSHTPVGCDLTR